MPSKYWLVNITVKLIRVTVKDTNLPSSEDEFLEKFAGYAIFSLIDFLLDYNQVKFDKKLQNLIGIITPLNLIKMIITPQGATNLVAEFVKIIHKVLTDHILNKTELFLDNIEIKRLKNT